MLTGIVSFQLVSLLKKSCDGRSQFIIREGQESTRPSLDQTDLSYTRVGPRTRERGQIENDMTQQTREMNSARLTSRVQQSRDITCWIAYDSSHLVCKVGNCFSTPSQPFRIYQGETQLRSSQVRLFTVINSLHTVSSVRGTSISTNWMN